jgi:hypothetical protein
VVLPRWSVPGGSFAGVCKFSVVLRSCFCLRGEVTPSLCSRLELGSFLPKP